MRQISKFYDIKTGREVDFEKEILIHINEYEDYDDYVKWREENFREEITYVESPYERTRASVYATGNRWAIENFNATH